MSTDQADLLRRIKKLTGSFETHSLIASFKCYREIGRDRVQQVTVEIYDGGPELNPNLRYSVSATTDDGKTATGNPDSTVEMALSHVHWRDLDG